MRNLCAIFLLLLLFVCLVNDRQKLFTINNFYLADGAASRTEVGFLKPLWLFLFCAEEELVSCVYVRSGIIPVRVVKLNVFNHEPPDVLN